jgi:uncharacterized lipoprotein YajG
MKKIFLVFIAVVLITGCEKNNNTCNCSNPLEDLAWLRELKSSFTNCTCRIAIMQATYDKQTVFYTIMNDPLCDGYFPVVLQDCTGAQVKVYGQPSGDEFGNEVKDRRELYSCKTE